MNLSVIKNFFLERVNLENWLCLSIFLLPTYLIKVDIFIFPTNILEIIIAVGFFWWFLDRKHTFSFRTAQIKYTKYLLPLGLIFFGLITGTILSGNYCVGLGIIKGWFIFPLLFLFVSSEILDSQKLKRLFRWFYFSALTIALVSVGYWFFGQMTFDARLKAVFNSPNYLAMYLSPAIAIGLVLFRENKKFYFASLGLIFLAIFFTYSFSAWIAVAASSIVTIFLTKGVSKRTLCGLAGIILFILISFFVFELKNKKVQDVVSFSERSSVSSRLMIWRTAEKLIQDNVFWGIGPGNFQNKYLEYQKFYPPYLEWAVPHPHNIFLAFWLYSGITGLFGFLFLLSIFFREFFKEQKNALKFMALGMMIIFLVQGLADATYFKNDLAIIFWLACLGMMKKL